MIAEIGVSRLSGEVCAPPSKSMAHRLILLAALSGGRCKVSNLYTSEDVLAMLDCIRALGAEAVYENGVAEIDGAGFLKNISPALDCRESGNTHTQVFDTPLPFHRQTDNPERLKAPYGAPAGGV